MLGLLVILVIIYLPLFVDPAPVTYPELKSFVIGEKVNDGSRPYGELVDSTPPLTCWFYGFVDMLFGRGLLARHILAFVILFLQSAYVGVMFIDKKVFTESTYLPSFIFSILVFFSFDTLALTGELLASGFLLLCISTLLKVIEFRSQRDEAFLNLGIYIGIASLFDLSASFFLVAASMILLIYARTTFRCYLLSVFGFVLPHFLLISSYFLKGEAGELMRYYYAANLSFSPGRLMETKELLVLGAVPAAYFLIAIVMLNRQSRLTKYQTHVVQIMFLWMLFGSLQAFLSGQLRPQTFITLVPVLSFFITHLLLVTRRKRLAEIHLWLLIAGVIGVSYLSRYGYLDKVKYDLLVVQNKESYPNLNNKRILVLENDLPLYLSNELATPFFNWQLSKELFAEPDYYHNVIRVHKAFQQDPPQVIVDPENYMQAFLHRIPQLKEQYYLSSPGIYYRREGSGLPVNN